MKVHRPNAKVIPHDLFNLLMPEVGNLAELKAIFFIAHQTSGRGKEWDWISESQFRDGITRKRDGKVINKGTGLTTPAIKQGIERALEHGHILRRYVCRSCRNIVEKTEVIRRAYKTRHGEGTTEILEVPARCPHCQNKLRGNYIAEYSLNWLDEEDEETTKQRLEVTTKQRLVDPLNNVSETTKQRLVTEEHTEELPEEQEQKNQDFLSFLEDPEPQSARERVQDALVWLLEMPWPDDPWLAKTWDKALDSLCRETRKTLSKSHFNNECAQAVKAAVEKLVTKRGEYPLQKATSPNTAVVELILKSLIDNQRQDAARSEWHEATERSLAAFEARQAEAVKQDPWWSQRLLDLECQMSKDMFNEYLKGTVLLERADGRIKIGVKNQYAKAWLENRLLPILKRAVRMDGITEIELEVMT